MNDEGDYVRSALPVYRQSYDRRLQLNYLNNQLDEDPRDPYTTKKSRRRLRQETGVSILNGRMHQHYEQDDSSRY